VLEATEALLTVAAQRIFCDGKGLTAWSLSDLDGFFRREALNAESTAFRVIGAEPGVDQ
jgi:hypothetical protein